MKISYILQLKDMSIMLAFGFALGIFYGMLNIHNKIKKIFVLQLFSDIIFIALSFGSLILLVNIINQGELRLFLICGYIIGFISERIIIGKLFAKNYKNMYTLIVKCVKSFQNSKFGRIIFK